MPGVVIIGAGQAAYQCAESLRQDDYDGPITLIGDEAYPPYQRPPLSKSYLLGDVDKQRLLFRTEAYYQEHQIDLRLNTRVIEIHRSEHRLSLDSGEQLTYDKLVIATGASVRRLPVPGADAEGVCYLKTIDDIDHIEAQLKQSERVVVIGAGFIGLEFAAVASKLGKQVEVIEAMDRVMGRVVHPLISEYFSTLHQQHGVTIHCGTAVTEIEAKHGHVKRVLCADDKSFAADLVVVGIGVIANTELAEQCGLVCGGGVVVDEDGRSSDPNIFAAGDCTIYRHPFMQQPIRLESVQNAADQAKTVAATLAGQHKPYQTVPWFWSDQFDAKLQMVGLSMDCDSSVLRGNQDEGKFSIFHFRGDKLRAIDSVNKPADHMMGRKLLAAGISPSIEQAADTDFALKSLLG